MYGIKDTRTYQHSSILFIVTVLVIVITQPLSPRHKPKGNGISGRHCTIVWRIWNFDTNEYPNIFVSKKTIRTNIRIYSYQKNNTNEYPNIFVSKKWYERISEYIRIKKMIRIWYERIFLTENIRIYEYIYIK